ncbi:hypothetical protein ACIRPX_29200 [Streptomyces sp. NPDC101225]|uniref:hypothetical protein n=1 Tax=Streptomyces sp. NPDC101225 TaxID=3366135 RepID=UPI003811E4CF
MVTIDRLTRSTPPRMVERLIGDIFSVLGRQKVVVRGAVAGALVVCRPRPGGP